MSDFFFPVMNIKSGSSEATQQNLPAASLKMISAAIPKACHFY